VPSASRTLDLFGDDALPQGFRYQSDFLTAEEEQSLLYQIEGLPFKEFDSTVSQESAGQFRSAGVMISMAEA
jgi:hypothetical protein